ncbi:MAG: cadmium-translocating P-type ATPase [Phycisphaerales bacterium]|nr:MAG: cadmium-translocating P-type ATPase [Phycisphaerales bacterium]
MIARFRDRELLRQVTLTSVAGLLIGTCWVLRWSHASATAETTLALAATVLCGGPIVLGALRGLVAREVNVDELVSLAIIAALTIGEYLTAATVGFIMVLGSLLESYTSGKAKRAIESLVELTPDTARVVENGANRMVRTDEVHVGQTVLIKPGEKNPVDGLVVDGSAVVDQAAVTGESTPIDVTPGSDVFAGTFVHDGALTVRATRVGEDSTLGKIVSLINDAEKHQARIVQSADAFAKWFTPAILALACGVWLASGDFVRCVSVLVVGCPCALILATPTAIVAAMGNAAKRGLMIKGGRFLEAVGEIDTVVFDKTGTLTEGRPLVQAVHSLDGVASDEILVWSASVEQKSEHPFAEAIVREAERRKLMVKPVSQFESRVGLGVSGTVGGNRIRVGRREFVAGAEAHASGDSIGTTLWVSRDDRCVGRIAMVDSARKSATPAIGELKLLGIPDVHLLSGDRTAVVESLATEVGVDAWAGELLPDGKVERLRTMQQMGKKTMYVGDGINDGPALATSHVGVAMGAGASPLALETADIGILKADLSLVPALVRLGRVTRRRIRENLLVFAVLYNGAAIVLASLGVLSPIMAAIAHNVGSVAVVLNSARLIRWGC